MIMRINLTAVASAKSRLDAAVKQTALSQIPGVNFCMVDASNNILFSHAAGISSSEEKAHPLDDNTVFWGASICKVIAGVAAVQLVEQGKIDLDDEDVVYKYLPELKDTKVLAGWEKQKNDGSEEEEEVPVWKEPMGKVTLRRLLTHTSGFSYGFADFNYIKWIMQDPAPRYAHTEEIMLCQPFLADPGTEFSYGISLDVAGILVERISGQKLEEYFQENIFAPIGLKSTTFFPTEDMKSRLLTVHFRDAAGNLAAREVHPYPVGLKEGDNSSNCFCSGGGGLFSTIGDYTTFLSKVFLNHGGGVLKLETLDLMFENSLPKSIAPESEWSRRLVPVAQIAPTVMNDITAWYDQPGLQWHGLAIFVLGEDVPCGRKKGTALWGGLPNCYWWADRTTGVCGLMVAGIMPYDDKVVVSLRDSVEADLYAGLEHDS